MNINPLTRTYYYDGALLNQSTFIMDQQYVRDLTQYQNNALYDPGVINGLAPTGQGSTTLTISEGAAITEMGVSLFTASATTLDMTSTSEISNAGTYQIALQYSDSMTSNTPQSTLEQSMTITEQPVLVVQPDGETLTNIVLICSVTVDSNFNITAIDTTSGTNRQSATLKLALSTPTPPAEMLAMQTPVSGKRKTKQVQAAPQTITAPLSLGDNAPTDGTLNVGLTLSGNSAHSALSCQGSGAAGASLSVALVCEDAGGDTSLITASDNDVLRWRLDSYGQSWTNADLGPSSGQTVVTDALSALKSARIVSVKPKAGQQPRIGVDPKSLSTSAPAALSADAAMVSYPALTCLLIQAVQQLSDKLDQLNAPKS